MKLVALLGIALVGSASATVTLQFNAPNFLGEADQASGITWGVTVDVGGDGFDAYEAPASLANGLFGGSDDDSLFLSAFTTPASGFVTAVAGVPDAEGQAFAIIWFDSTLSAGSDAQVTNTYGLYTQPDFVMPAPGNTQAFVVTNVGPKNPTTNFAGIPEPSITLLGALGFLGLIRRRR